MDLAAYLGDVLGKQKAVTGSNMRFAARPHGPFCTSSLDALPLAFRALESEAAPACLCLVQIHADMRSICKLHGTAGPHEQAGCVSSNHSMGEPPVWHDKSLGMHQAVDQAFSMARCCLSGLLVAWLTLVPHKC